MTLWDSPTAIDSINTPTLAANAQVNYPQPLTGPGGNPQVPYDVSGFDFVILSVVGAPVAGAVNVTPQFLDANGNLIGGFSPIVTTVQSGIVEPIVVAIRCLGPFLRLNVQARSAAGGNTATIQIYGSNRDFRFDGPYTPSSEGTILHDANLLPLGASGTVTDTVSVPYAGPAFFSFSTSNMGLNVAAAVQYLPFAGSTFRTIAIVQTATASGVMTTPVPLWVPPAPLQVVYTNFTTTALTVEGVLIAA